MDAATFTERVAARIAALPGVEVEILRPLALRIDALGRDSTLDLGSAWRRVCLDPSQLDEVIAGISRSFLPAVEKAELDPGRVLPLLRTLGDLGRLCEGRSALARPPSFPFVGELVVTLVHDDGGSLRVLSRFDADRLARPDPALLALAIENLQQRVPFELVGEGPIRQLLAGGSFDATLLLLSEPWKSMRQGGPLLAAAPARGVLLLALDEDPATLGELSALSQEVWRSRPHPLSPSILRRTPAGWTLS